MKIIRHVSRAARYALFAFIVGCALALSVIRFWLLPEVSRFRGELQARAGDLIGETVRIGSISARMQGLEPQLVLHDFTIIDQEAVTPALSFRRVRLGISLLSSLLERSPALTSLRLEDARITIVRQRDGSIAIRGLNAGNGPPAWLFSLKSIQLRNVDLQWQDLQAGSPLITFGRVNVRGLNEDARHRLSAAVELSPGIGKSLRLVADLQGEETDPRMWGGRVYLESEDFRPEWMADLYSFPATLRSGLADLRLWSEWRQGTVETLRGTLELTKPIVAYISDGGVESQLGLDELSSRFSWESKGDAWRFSLNQLRMAIAGQIWPETDLVVEVGRDDSSRRRTLRAAISTLRLEDLQILQNVLPPGELRDALRGMAPRGTLQQAQLVYGLDGENAWGVCGGFRDVAINAWKNIPGLGNLSGHVCGNDQRGGVGFSSRGASLSSPQLWQKPLPLQALQVIVNWSRDVGKLRLDIPTAIFEASGIRGQAALTVDLPKAGAETPFIDLRARFADVDAKALRDYLPLPAMPGASSAWLKEAFDGGRINQAEILFFGSVADFPFRGREGVFQAYADVENLDLDFDPDWPHVTGLSGRIGFAGAGMSFDARSGVIGGAQIREAHGQTSDFDRDPWLTVTGKISTDIPQSMSFLAQTPLRQIPQRLLRVADPHGQSEIDLTLKVPLVSELGDVQVDGTATLKDARVDFSAVGLSVERMAGDLHFSERGLSARNITASALEKPVRVDIAQEGNRIRVDLHGAAAVEDLRRLAPGSALWGYVDGGFDYRLTAEIHQPTTPPSEPLHLLLSSDLSGLGVRLPAPLGKPAGARRDMRLDLQLQAGSSTPLRVVYGNDVQAQLWLTESSADVSIDGGDIAIGRASLGGSHEPGLRVQARLGEVDGEAWKAFAAGFGDGLSSQGGLMRAFALRTDRLIWDDKVLGPVAVDLNREGQEWKGTIESQLGLGRFWLQIPDYGHPLAKLDFDVLRLPEGAVGLPKPSADEGMAADSMPIVEIHARQTFWRGADLGALELITERWTQGLNIKKLALQHRNHDLQVKGSWMLADGKSETRLDGKLNVTDLGLFLASLGYAKEIRDTPSEARFSLSWPGAPQQLTSTGVRGGIDLNLGRGSVLKMEPGLGRALAVLNLDSLRRLLILDFSDMFGKGLVYDGMRGRFELGGGQARTSGFLIDAVAGSILITGRVGLVAKDLDETVTVIPHTLASLPIAGAMVGGAAVGAAISMAGKLVGQDSVSIASNRYAIKGSWDNPQVSRIDGNMPLDVLDRAWSGLKNFSGFGSRGVEVGNE